MRQCVLRVTSSTPVGMPHVQRETIQPVDDLKLWLAASGRVKDFLQLISHRRTTEAVFGLMYSEWNRRHAQ